MGQATTGEKCEGLSAPVLLVDDDPHVLSACRRKLGRVLDLHLAEGPEAGLEKIAEHRFAVVVSDMQMPVMSGVEFLGKVKTACPDTVRVMLTGNADQQTAVDAVNDGAIFRFLTKPCPPEILRGTIEEAIKQHRLITAEQDLLHNTVRGSVKLLVDVLSMADPAAFERSLLLRTRVKQVCEKLKIAHSWDLEIAAMLCDLGLMTLPIELRNKMAENRPLSGKEHEMVDAVPTTTYRLIGQIPRLEPVAAALSLLTESTRSHAEIAYEDLDDSDPAHGPMVLRILRDLGRLEAGGLTTKDAATRLAENEDSLAPTLLNRVIGCLVETGAVKLEPITVKVKNLEVGVVLAEDVVTFDERLLVRAGVSISDTLIEALLNHSRCARIADHVVVLGEAA